jgi:hypothetical protein
MAEKSANDAPNPLLARFLHIFTAQEANTRKNSDGNNPTQIQNEGDMTFRTYMFCICMLKPRLSEAEKLKFWYNIMRCTRDFSNGSGQIRKKSLDIGLLDDSSGSFDFVSDHLAKEIRGDLVVSFLCDAVCGALSTISTANKARSVSEFACMYVCIYIYIYMYIYIYTYVFIYIYTHIRIYIYIRIYIRTYVYIHIHVYVFIYKHTNVYVYVYMCMYVCMYVCVCVCMYIYIFIYACCTHNTCMCAQIAQHICVL